MTDRPEKMGPLAADHPIIDSQCRACDVPFKAGDYVTVIALGPGDDREGRAKARAGRPYSAVGAVVHWACATGEER